MSNQKKENVTLSQQLLESYRSALYKVKDFFDKVSEHKITIDDSDLVDSVLKQGEKLGKNIETLAILEQKVLKEETEKSSRRGNVKTSLFEND